MIAKFNVVRAVDAPEACQRYIDGHQQVLAAYGVTKVTSANLEWRHDPFTYLVTVETEDSSRALGGCRVQLRSPQLRMPLEDAVALLDDRIYGYVDKLGNYLVAETCGLWNSKEVAGLGIGSMFLGRVSTAITPFLNVPYLMCLCSPATLRNCQKVGFEIVRELGAAGTFYYPKEDLVATLMIIEDLHELPFAAPAERDYINNLRANPTQRLVQRGPKGYLEALFDIRISPPQPLNAGTL